MPFRHIHKYIRISQFVTANIFNLRRRQLQIIIGSMSAFVLRFRASNALHCAKQYMYNGNTLHACSWVCTERRRYYAADASATTATTATAAAGNKEGGSGAQTNAEAEFLQKLRKRLDNEVQIGKVVPVFKKALYHGDRTAIKDENGEYSYHQIYGGATKLAAEISLLCGERG